MLIPNEMHGKLEIAFTNLFNQARRGLRRETMYSRTIISIEDGSLTYTDVPDKEFFTKAYMQGKGSSI
jgi:hypothetical protein